MALSQTDRPYRAHFVRYYRRMGGGEQINRLTDKEFYWHSIRHYTVTYLIKHHIPESVIKDLIGWESSDMVSVYNDMTADDMLGWYFDENGIRDIKPSSLNYIS